MLQCAKVHADGPCLAANDAVFPAMQLPTVCARPPFLHLLSVADAAAAAVESTAMMPYGDLAAPTSFVFGSHRHVFRLL